MKQALSVASECAPLVKTGGLADVAGALPGAMAGQGWAVRTLIPGYPAVLAAVKKPKVVLKAPSFYGGPVRVLAGSAAGLDLLVLDAPHLFERDGTPYLDSNGNDWPDNPQRFAALSNMAARLAVDGVGNWRPDVVHGHDWQAGLTPLYLRDAPNRPGTLLTIHNVAFHGLAPASAMASLGLDRADFTSDGFEFWNQISALKAGVVYSDKINTVSATYAHELLTPEFGMGMDGVLKTRAHDLSGILNGIDTQVWNPATDPAIATYTTPRGKAKAKAALRAEFALAEADGPLTVVVSRLSEQKGLDALLAALPALIDHGGQLALLGTGHKALESAWRAAASHPNVSVHIGYDEARSHRMIAGADAILVPSRFEPCGLTQLYGLRYGTLPVVARTGGLADTVIDANPVALASGVATGIQFYPVSADAIAGAFARLLTLWRDPAAWAKMQRNAMRQPVGWEASAPVYAALYESIAR
jgi:starch synthase